MSVMAVRRLALRLTERYAAEGPPIDVGRIAAELGLEVVCADLGAGVSGLLVASSQGAQICVNETDHPKRRRFTIAHEVGHHVLRHQFTPGEHVHVDRGNFISQRSPRSAAGVDRKEIEANQFAAHLLMPDDLVRRHVESLGSLSLVDWQVAKLAEKFDVSEQAMTIRLTTMGLL
jgi:Zn-dependent peptidase ImmA (M78 family)